MRTLQTKGRSVTQTVNGMDYVQSCSWFRGRISESARANGQRKPSRTTLEVVCVGRKARPSVEEASQARDGRGQGRHGTAQPNRSKLPDPSLAFAATPPAISLPRPHSMKARASAHRNSLSLLHLLPLGHRIRSRCCGFSLFCSV